MGPAFYVMAILGCGDAGTACEQVRVTPTHYVSADACNAATPQQLMDNSDVAFPVVMAECRPASTQMASLERPQG